LATVGWIYREKSAVSWKRSIQTTRSSLLRACRFTIYDLRVPTTTLNFAITFYRKS